MKPIHYTYIRRAFRRGLTLFMILCLLPLQAPAAELVDNIGQLTRSWRLPLCDGTSLTQTTLRHNDAGIQEERILEWTPQSLATPLVVTGGPYIGDLSTVTAAASRLSSQSIEVLAGLNAGYFSMDSGVPMGTLVTEGIVRAASAYSQSLGFNDQGRAYIGELSFRATLYADINGEAREIAVNNVNNVRTKNGLYLYTPDFGTTTKTTSKGTHIVINTTDNLRLGQSVYGRIAAVLTDTTEAAALQPGQMVLSCRNDGPLDRLNGLTEGMDIVIAASANYDWWYSCAYIVSGYQRLLTNGSVASGLEAGRNPRTAVGIKADGTCVFYTVDGRQSGYSAGLSLTETAARLRSLGCTEAINLDGGGSTAIGGTYPGTSVFSLRNQPSEGTQRKVANMVFLVNRTQHTGVAGHLYIYRTEQGTLLNPGVRILQGGVMQLDVRAADTQYHPLTPPGSVLWDSEDEDIGQISSSGFFSALNAGTVRITAQGGGVAGLTDIRVVDTLTSLQVKDEATGDTVDKLSLQPGQSIDLTASGLYEGEDVLTQDTCFTWTLQGDLGTVDSQGLLTATSLRGGAGYLIVSGGGLSKTIPVSLGHPAEVLEDFENTADTFAPGDANIGFSLETDRNQVQFGQKAGRISYRFENWSLSGETIRLPLDMPLPGHPAAAVLWLKGDGSQNFLSLIVENESGEESILGTGTLEDTAYRRVSVSLPVDAERVIALQVTLGPDYNAGGVISNMFYLDQITAAYDLAIDTSPPALTLQSAVNDTEAGLLSLKALITDNGSDAVRRQDITLLWNGQQTAFTYDVMTKQLTAALPLPVSGYHRLCIEAIDPSGNRARLEHVIQQPVTYTVRSFFDIRESWAAPYIDALDQRGILTAREDLGLRYFNPPDVLTREQFAVFMARVLALDLTRYENINLPYADLADLPTGSIREIKAMYALDIIHGRSSNGTLIFDPYGPITRADFMTIVGRALPKGFLVQPIQGYSDAASVPAYALEHVELLTSLGVVSGYPDATLRPLRAVTREEAAKMLFFLY